MNIILTIVFSSSVDYTKYRIFMNFRPFLLIFFLLAPIFSGCSGGEEDQSRETKKREFALPVQIGKVVFRDVVDQVRTVGNIQAEQRVVITAEVKGQVVGIAVEEGMKVKAGDLLAQIDPREYRLEWERLKTNLAVAEKEYEKSLAGLRPEEKEKLEATVRAAESSLRLAIKEKSRLEKLVVDGFVSQSDLDDAVDRALQARESLKAAKAGLAAGHRSRKEDIVQKKLKVEETLKRIAMANLNLSRSEIRAPFSGVIISKEIERGAFADPGTPIVKMIGSSRLKAVLEVPQSYRDKLEKMEGAEFFVRELHLRFKQGKNVARLVRVIPDANIYSGNIKVQIDLPDPDPSLFPGLNLEALLNFGTRHQVMHVPSISLVITDKGTVVYIVKEDLAQLVPVKAYKEQNDYVEVEDFTHQLGPDADLILRGSGAVFPGAKVFPTNPQPEAKPPFSAASKDAEVNKEPPNPPET